MEAISECADLRDLPLAVGADPARPPPALKSIAMARAKVAKALLISKRAAESKHYAGKWRYNIVGAVQGKCKDPDKPLRSWLKRGAPMGITE